MHRTMIVVALLALAGCGADPYKQAKANYLACLDRNGVNGCQNEKARLDVEAQHIRLRNEMDAASPPMVLGAPTPAITTRQPINCTTIGNTMTCY